VWIENSEWQKIKGECDKQSLTPADPLDSSDSGGGSGCQPQTFYLDSDGDGYGNQNNSTTTFEKLEGYVSDNTDCDDTDKNINPSLNEKCNLEPETPACTPNQSCLDWHPLPEAITCGQTFTQIRTCTDLNNCGTDEGKPIESQEASGTQ